MRAATIITAGIKYLAIGRKGTSKMKKTIYVGTAHSVIDELATLIKTLTPRKNNYIEISILAGMQRDKVADHLDTYRYQVTEIDPTINERVINLLINKETN